ncbi:MAG: hypothetical protein LBT62_03905 [Deltaproteobacteria bacterium]|nr:hypothetical protein [Deltaproteobacteria bacterium]
MQADCQTAKQPGDPRSLRVAAMSASGGVEWTPMALSNPFSAKWARDCFSGAVDDQASVHLDGNDGSMRSWFVKTIPYDA